MISVSLEDRDNWNTLREKVVDQEIQLNTSAHEAFDIAIELTPSRYADRIQDAAAHCDLTNIRIVRKVIKATNRILGNRSDLSEALLSRVVPSTVLLAALHYKGIDDGPGLDLVLKYDPEDDWSRFFEDSNEEKEEERSDAKWRPLFEKLGIHGFDDYELLVAEFLQSGMFDSSKVATIIDRYTAENDAMIAQAAVREFSQRLIWDYRLTEAELLTEAEELVPCVHLIDAHRITSLHHALQELEGGEVVAQAILDRWITAFKAKNLEEFNDDDPFGRKVHPAIQAEFDAAKSRAQSKLTVLTACKHIAENRGWSLRQEIAMKAATVADFQNTITSVDIEDLRIFMYEMVKMTAKRGGYREHFGPATDRFVEACKNLMQEPNVGRLNKLIKTLFESSEIGHLLVAPATDAVSEQSSKSETADKHVNSA